MAAEKAKDGNANSNDPLTRIVFVTPVGLRRAYTKWNRNTQAHLRYERMAMKNSVKGAAGDRFARRQQQQETPEQKKVREQQQQKQVVHLVK